MSRLGMSFSGLGRGASGVINNSFGRLLGGQIIREGPPPDGDSGDDPFGGGGFGGLEAPLNVCNNFGGNIE